MGRAASLRGWWWALGLLAVLAGRLAMVPAHLVLDYNEGWNAFQALHAMGGGRLYPAAGAFTGNNYPPLSFYVVGAVGRWLGDMIIAGRLVSLASQLAVAGAIWLLAGRLSPRGSAAPWWAVMLFALANATLFRAYVAMDDPQWLGHALMMAGLVVLVWRAGPAGLRRAAVAAALMLAGGLVKHNIVGVPGAVGLWLLACDRRSFGVFALVGLAGLAGAVWADHALFGGRMFADILGVERDYALGRMARHAALLAVWGPLLALAWPLWRAPDARARLLVLGACLSVPVGIVEGSGAGVDVNAHFDSLIFLSLAVAVARGQARQALPLWLTRGALAVAGVWGLVASGQEIAGLRGAVAAQQPFIQRLAAVPGPAGCELLALCYWAGKDFALDFFIYNQQLEKGHGAAAVSALLAGRQLGAIEVEALDDGPHPSALRGLIRAHYRPAYVAGNRAILVPRP